MKSNSEKEELIANLKEDIISIQELSKECIGTTDELYYSELAEVIIFALNLIKKST